MARPPSAAPSALHTCAGPVCLNGMKSPPASHEGGFSPSEQISVAECDYLVDLDDPGAATALQPRYRQLAEWEVGMPALRPGT